MVTDTPILDYADLAGQWLLAALVVLAFVVAVRAIRSAYLAEQSAANQSEWTQHLPACGLCGARRLLTDTEIIVLDDIGHRVADSYAVAVCHDCRCAITVHEQESAA